MGKPRLERRDGKAQRKKAEKADVKTAKRHGPRAQRSTLPVPVRHE